ncbi:DegT/DnrJ/EryC1/StrS family aminotransferase [Oscillatoria sp. CS-180]|uniref:DegT/DnrJ/EryC1/StrS family aminotransferase n=1 Tax=Oscillatoria sp. CS-180 TaxID=3021720 RepID=UPI00233142BF|nr:DegT/DnrJ/EryC1/StrS family aminotransferase [Oscillatoria sp. CS-180]MDB9525801.1 DegT/DnrJ/EryC1/StrS family aminotransferase [Oscillatoria sp. CS-180]
MSQNKVPILDLKPQYQAIQTEIKAAVNRVLESGQFILGEEVGNFESAAAAYLGSKHAIGVNSGTDALMIALRALGVEPGDEVITTPFSFFATAESISNVGAKPIFVDIDAASFNLNPEQIRDQITDKTKAILPVHLFGNPAAMAQILDIAEAHNLKVLEDCAQSFGSAYKGDCIGCDGGCQDDVRNSITGQRTGAIGDAGAFSFFPTKNLGAYGDGGLITTNDDAVAELARKLRIHGTLKRYHNEMLGYNSRLDAIQAAILGVKLPYVDKWNQQRRQVADTYNRLLENVPGIVTPAVTAGHVFHQYTLRILNGKRDAVKEYLASQGIGAMVYYPVPQDCLPVYQGQFPTYPVSEQVAKEVLSLPMWPELEEAIQERIVATLKDAIAL